MLKIDLFTRYFIEHALRKFWRLTTLTNIKTMFHSNKFLYLHSLICNLKSSLWNFNALNELLQVAKLWWAKWWSSFKITNLLAEYFSGILMSFTWCNLYIRKGTSLTQTCKISSLTSSTSDFILKINVALANRLNYSGLLI